MLCDTCLDQNVIPILKSESNTVQQEAKNRRTRNDIMHVAKGQVCPRQPGMESLYLIPALWFLYTQQNYLFFLELIALLTYH